MIEHIPQQYLLSPVEKVQIVNDKGLVTDTFVPLQGKVYDYKGEYFFDVAGGTWWRWRKKVVKIISR